MRSYKFIVNIGNEFQTIGKWPFNTGENVNILGGDEDLNFPVFLVRVYKACEQIKIKL